MNEIKRVRVVPIAGCVVRDPVTGGVLTGMGRVVPLNVYWARRMRDGSVAVRQQAEPGNKRRKRAQR